MSGQGQQKGGQYGSSYQGNPGYMDPNSLYSNKQGLYGGYPMDLGAGYFSLGNTLRSQFGSQAPGMNGNGPVNPGTLGAPTAPQSPFGPPGGSFFGNNFGAPPSNPSSPFGGGGFFGNNFGPPNNVAPGAQPKPLATPMTNSYTPTAPGNVTPDSPEYAAWYYGLAPSTRAYAAAPGSQTAQNQYNAQFLPGAARF